MPVHKMYRVHQKGDPGVVYARVFATEVIDRGVCTDFMSGETIIAIVYKDEAEYCYA